MLWFGVPAGREGELFPPYTPPLSIFTGGLVSSEGRSTEGDGSGWCGRGAGGFKMLCTPDALEPRLWPPRPSLSVTEAPPGSWGGRACASSWWAGFRCEGEDDTTSLDGDCEARREEGWIADPLCDIESWSPARWRSRRPGH
jgi:hypothetical protein